MPEEKRCIGKEDIFAAADRLVEAGEKPSVTKVRIYLGQTLGVKGSPNKVAALLREWRAERAAQQPIEQAPLGLLPEEADQILKKAANGFNNILGELNVSFCHTIAEIRHKVARDHAAILEISIAAEREKAEMAADGEAEALQEIERLETEIEEKAARISGLEAALTTMNIELAVARATCDRLARENREQFDKLLTAISEKPAAPKPRKKGQPSCTV